jgi:hypothetical protein
LNCCPAISTIAYINFYLRGANIQNNLSAKKIFFQKLNVDYQHSIIFYFEGLVVLELLAEGELVGGGGGTKAPDLIALSTAISASLSCLSTLFNSVSLIMSPFCINSSFVSAGLLQEVNEKTMPPEKSIIKNL